MPIRSAPRSIPLRSCRKTRWSALDGGLKNVLVYVKAGVPTASIPPAPTTPVKVDQKGCIYTPRIVVAMVNQPVEFTNSDDTNHHIQAMAEINKELDRFPE